MDNALRVELENIQAIKHAIIEFGEHGITEFIGDNSNGKSTLSRVIKYVTSGDIKDKTIRNNLINDYEDEGKVLFTRGKEALLFIFRRDSTDSICLYTPDILDEAQTNSVTRNLSDKGYHELLYKFGFRVYSSGDICLQLFSTYGAIPFVTTSGKTNNEIVDDITEDKVAAEFLENYEKITALTFRARLKSIQQQQLQVKTLINSCTIYDYERYKQLAVDIGKIVAAIGNYQYYTIQEFDLPPNVDIIDVPRYQIPSVPIPAFGPIKSLIADGTQVLVDYENALNNRCPTCLRLFTEED